MTHKPMPVECCATLMRMPTNNIDPATLQAALLGYQVELQTIDRSIGRDPKTARTPGSDRSPIMAMLPGLTE
jgi:hypothetical protein